MSDIDHAAEAFRVLQLPTSMEDATEANALAYAQAHATLALAAATEKVAEQARIANLIALGQFTVAPGDMPIFRHVVFDHERGEGIHPEIRKGLGL